MLLLEVPLSFFFFLPFSVFFVTCRMICLGTRYWLLFFELIYGSLNFCLRVSNKSNVINVFREWCFLWPFFFVYKVVKVLKLVAWISYWPHESPIPLWQILSLNMLLMLPVLFSGLINWVTFQSHGSLWIHWLRISNFSYAAEISAFGVVAFWLHFGCIDTYTMFADHKGQVSRWAKKRSTD